MELRQLTALELGAAIKRGMVSIPEAAQAALDAIQARDGTFNSFITVTGERAMERAMALQKGVKDAQSPLYGVPMALKDNICTKGFKTSCASKILGDFRPPYDATVVERLAAAGALSLGKLNMDEFAMGSTSETSFYGPTRNPWDLTRVPGGSSGGGAAAAVLKSRGAELVELAFPVLEYGVPAYYIIAAAEASSNLSRFDGVKYGWRAEGYEDLTDLYNKTRTQGFGMEVKRRILLGTFVLSAGYYDAYYKKALQVKAVIKSAFDEAFTRCDLLLTPVAPTTAPMLGDSLGDPLKMYLSDIYTVPVNLAGLPALSMPCGFDAQGLPIGAQLIGPHFGEGRLLNAAHTFQLETDYHKRIPKGGEPA